MNLLKSLTGRVLLILVVLGQQSSFAEPLPVFKTGKFKFKSAEYKMAISFPTQFEQSISDREDDNATLYVLKVSSTVDKDLYMASATKHVSAYKNTVELADVSLKSFAEALNGEIRSENSFRYKKKEGKEALIYLPEQKLYAHYRVILVGIIQYQVIVLDSRESLSETAFSFFKSFQIL